METREPRKPGNVSEPARKREAQTPHPQEPMAGDRPEQGNSSGSRMKWAFWGFVAIAAFFLLTEHRAHLLGILPFLLLLACPLMHLFHHGRHGGGHQGHRGDGQGPSEGDGK